MDLLERSAMLASRADRTGHFAELPRPWAEESNVGSGKCITGLGCFFLLLLMTNNKVNIIGNNLVSFEDAL